MKRWLIFLFWLCAGPAFAQTLRISGWCEQGAQQINVGGVLSSPTTLVQASYPACRVTVFQAGTITKETIYADNMMTPLANPFTLTPGNGYWFFYPAMDTDHVDITFDQGGIPTPYTLGDVAAAGGSGGGGGGGPGTVTRVTFPTIPAWLTASVATNTTTPAISIVVATGQASNQVIGTCGSATTFGPCSLGATDLPGTIVYNNQANTYSTGGQNFAAASFLTIPSGPGYAPTNSGMIGYDTTANAYRLGIAGTDFIIAPLLNGAFTVGHCLEYSTTPAPSIIDAGFPCSMGGGGGGSPLTVQVGGTSTGTASATLNFNSGSGINQTCSYNAGASRNDCTPALDTAYALSRATDQNGTDATCIDASGSGTSYTCSVTPGLTGYTRNMRIYFVPQTTSGAAPTLNVTGIGPLPLQWNINGTLTNVAAGQLVAALPYMLTAWGSPPTALVVQPTAYAPNTVQSCGTTIACSHTILSVPQIVTGSVALSSGTPSTAAITGLSPGFTSASTYHCTVSDATTAANEVTVLAAGYVSGTAFTITGPSTVTDVVHYICVGN